MSKTANDRHGDALNIGDHVLVTPIGHETSLPYTGVVDGIESPDMVHVTPDEEAMCRYFKGVEDLPTHTARLTRITATQAEHYNDMDAHEAEGDAILRRAMRIPA
jgi:hypothetical protein